MGYAVDVQERLGELQRLELAGVEVSTVDLGPDAYIRRWFRDGRETWEIAPEFLAALTVANIPANEPNVERATLYRKLPPDAPDEVKWHSIVKGYSERGWQSHASKTTVGFH